MTFAISTSQVLIGLAVAWIIAFYFYWRYARGFHPNSEYRSYDLLFLTLVLSVVMARVVAVLGNFNYYFHGADGLQFLNIFDLDLNYLAIVFVPLLAFQFEVFNIEKLSAWKRSSGRFISFGCILVMLVEVAQIIRGLVNIWPSNLILYHAVTAVLLGLVAVVLSVNLKNVKLKVPTYVSLIVIAAGIILINMVFPVLNTTELNTTIVSQVVLCILALIPYVRRLPKSAQLSRPKPTDFRSL